MHCKNCGEECKVGQQLCLKCGRLLSEDSNPVVTSECINNNIVLNVLGFIFPIIGLIIWLFMRNKKPEQAGNLMKWSIIGWAFWFIIKCI